MSLDEESNPQVLEQKPSSQFRVIQPQKVEASPAEISKLISFIARRRSSAPQEQSRNQKKKICSTTIKSLLSLLVVSYCLAISSLMIASYSRLYSLPSLPPY